MNKDAADKDKGEDVKLWGVFLFGLIGATASTLAVTLSPYLFLRFVFLNRSQVFDEQQLYTNSSSFFAICRAFILQFYPILKLQFGHLRKTVEWFSIQVFNCLYFLTIFKLALLQVKVQSIKLLKNRFVLCFLQKISVFLILYSVKICLRNQVFSFVNYR